MSIIIVNWNTSHLLASCLRSIVERPDGLDCEILVVDNASIDASVDHLVCEFPGIELIRNTKNVGFARANNQAQRTCRGKYVLFLNSDTYLAGDTLPALVRFMELHPDAGASSPRLQQPDGRPQPFAFGGDPTPAYLLRRGAMHLLFHRPLHDWKTTQVQTVDWVSGACLLVRREAMEQIGGFDENFFMYFEDVDLCLRLRKQGWKIYYNPDVSITHIGGASLSQNRTRTRWYDASLRYFYAKHYSPFARAALELMLPFYRRMA